MICIGLGKGTTLLESLPCPMTNSRVQLSAFKSWQMMNTKNKINYINKKCYSACNSAKTTSQLVLLFLAFWSCMCFFVVSNAKKLWTSRVEKQYAAPPNCHIPPQNSTSGQKSLHFWLVQVTAIHIVSTRKSRKGMYMGSIPWVFSQFCWLRAEKCSEALNAGKT